eukprot:883750-Rhodomonas_salina.2
MRRASDRSVAGEPKSGRACPLWMSRSNGEMFNDCGEHAVGQCRLAPWDDAVRALAHDYHRIPVEGG